jgi:hypothetical protein
MTTVKFIESLKASAAIVLTDKSIHPSKIADAIDATFIEWMSLHPGEVSAAQIEDVRKTSMWLRGQ